MDAVNWAGRAVVNRLRPVWAQSHSQTFEIQRYIDRKWCVGCSWGSWIIPKKNRLLQLYLTEQTICLLSQVKFSELTVDMFRMLQALEREPMNLASQMNKPGMQVSFVSVTNLAAGLNSLGEGKKKRSYLYCHCAKPVRKADVALTWSWWRVAQICGVWLK